MYSVMIIYINIIESKESESDITGSRFLKPSSLKTGACGIHVTYTCCL